MSIQRCGDNYTLTCDNCGYEHPDLFTDFAEAVEAKRDDGWRSKMIDNEWEDWCDECCELAAYGDFAGGDFDD